MSFSFPWFYSFLDLTYKLGRPLKNVKLKWHCIMHLKSCVTYLLNIQLYCHKHCSSKHVPMRPFTHLSLFCSSIFNMHCFIGYLEITRTYLDQYKHSTERANKWRLHYCRFPKHPRHWYDNARCLKQNKQILERCGCFSENRIMFYNLYLLVLQYARMAVTAASPKAKTNFVQCVYFQREKKWGYMTDGIYIQCCH